MVFQEFISTVARRMEERYKDNYEPGEGEPGK